MSKIGKKLFHQFIVASSEIQNFACVQMLKICIYSQNMQIIHTISQPDTSWPFKILTRPVFGSSLYVSVIQILSLFCLISGFATKDPLFLGWDGRLPWESLIAEADRMLASKTEVESAVFQHNQKTINKVQEWLQFDKFQV